MAYQYEHLRTPILKYILLQYGIRLEPNMIFISKYEYIENKFYIAINHPNILFYSYNGIDFVEFDNNNKVIRLKVTYQLSDFFIHEDGS